MAGVKYNPDGTLVKPRIVTIHQLWAKTTGGGSLRLEAPSTAELWTNYYDGKRRGIYCGVIGTGERQGEDPAEAAAYRAELSRISRTSCPVVDEYLQMRHFVKALPPERFEEIDETWFAGLPWLRMWLQAQKRKRREYCQRNNITPNPPSELPWWKRGRPWKD